MNKSTLTKAVGFALAGTFLLQGCAVPPAHNNGERKASGHMEPMRVERDDLSRNSPMKKMTGLWVDTTPVPMNGQPLGSRAATLDCPITFTAKGRVSVTEFAHTVTNLCSTPVTVTPDAMAALNDKSTGVSNVITGVSWVNQPLSGLLDLVTVKLGLGWKYENNAISIFYVDTQVMHLHTMPGTTKMQTSTTTGGGNESFFNSGSTQSTEVSFESNMVNDIVEVIQSMVTPGLGRVSFSSSTGAVAVTDRAQNLRAIESYVEQENKRLTRQVLLNVKVLSVSINSQNAVDLDWGTVYQHLDRYGLLANTGNGSQRSGSGFNSSLSILNPSSRVNSVQALINALSTQGQVSTVASPSVVTMNLTPAPIVVGQRTAYLAKASNSTQDLVPATVATGFNMTVLPHLIKGSDMILQYSINLSDLTAMREISSGRNRIQLPDLNSQTLSQSVKMRSGQTLILAGFDHSVAEKETSLFSSKRGAKKDVTVVLITPVIAD